MATTTTSIRVSDALGQPQLLKTEADGLGVHTPHHTIEVDGLPLGAAKAMPTADAVAGLALGAPADVAWTVGGGTLIALLKAACGYLASLVTNTTGGATAALQTTGNASLATIASNGTSVVTTETLAATTIVAAATAVQVKAAGTRKTLDLINTGTGTIYFGYSAAVTAATGYPLAPAGSALDQGGSYGWARGSAPTTALFVFSVAGSTVLVKEGV